MLGSMRRRVRRRSQATHPRKWYALDMKPRTLLSSAAIVQAVVGVVLAVACAGSVFRLKAARTIAIKHGGFAANQLLEFGNLNMPSLRANAVPSIPADDDEHALAAWMYQLPAESAERRAREYAWLFGIGAAGCGIVVMLTCAARRACESLPHEVHVP